MSFAHEARQAATSVTTVAPRPRLSAASPVVARDPVPGTEDAAALEASMAEATCDMPTLCRLSLHSPGVLSHARLMRIFGSCHPGVSPADLVAGNPCLTPRFVLPAPAPAVGPRRTPGPTPSSGGTSGPATGRGLSLPSTTLAFNLGAAAVTIDLPASLAVRLPVPFRGAERVVFDLNASTSEFSFSVTINALPHVRIIARASATPEGQGTAGLTVQTTRTTCRAVDPAAARSALETAGMKLRDAIQAVQTPPAPDPEASELSRTFAPQARYAEVIGAVAKLKSEIDRVGAPCREVPVMSAEFGVQGPLTRPDEPAGPSTVPPASFIGGSLRLHF